jgi:hypothetical protein
VAAAARAHDGTIGIAHVQTEPATARIDANQHEFLRKPNLWVFVGELQ